MTPKQKIIELCSDPNMNEYELIKAIELEIVKIIPFDHEHKDVMGACGINNDIKLKFEHKGIKSVTIEMIEKTASKRELAFLFFQIIDKEKQEELKNSSITHQLEEIESLLDLLPSLQKLSARDFKKDSLPHENTPTNCHETDDSECWKCKYKNNCGKRISFGN